MAYSRTLNHFTSMQELATIWASSTSYLVNQPVIHNNFLYRCAVAHTSSGSFQTDLAAGQWERVSSAENAINWASGVYYVLNQLVIDNDKLYKCLVAHTSGGTFIADLQAAYWVEISKSEAGVFNYVENADAEVDTLGWNTYADAAGAQPVDGTGGSPNITFTRSITAPLRGDASFNLAKDAADRQGEGVAYDFSVDNADLAKVLTVTFDYEVLSGTYATGDLAVYLIQDPSGTPLVIQPAGYQVQAGTVGTKLKHIATFQTASNVTSYRLCVHVASVSATAYTLAIDNVVVGPQTVQYGAPVTDWTSYTPTITNLGSGSTTQRFAQWRRIGDSIEIEFRWQKDATAGSGASTVIMSLPPGLTVNANKLPNAANVPSGELYVGGAATNFKSGIDPAGVIFFNQTSSALVTGNQVAANSIWVGSVNNIPIQGWSSTVQMSNDTDTRVVAAKSRRSANQSIAVTTPTTVLFNTTEFDTHGSMNTSGVYTIPVSGIYEISGQYLYSAIASAAGYDAQIRLFINGADSDIQNSATKGTASQSDPQRFFFRKNLTAGQTVAIRAWHNVGAGLTILGDSTVVGLSVLNIVRLSGPSAIAASETVAARYYATGNRTPTTIKAVNYDTRVYDTHGAVTTVVGDAAGWRFTAPIAGKYRITVGSFQSAATVGGTLQVFKNSGSTTSYLVPTTTANIFQNGSIVLQVLAGDFIDIRSDSTPTLNNVASQILTVYIERIGS